MKNNTNFNSNYQVFFVRWALNSFAIWFVVSLLGRVTTTQPVVAIYLLAGLIFSLVNHFLRPLLVFLSIPAIIITLGVFSLFINGILIWIAVLLTPGLEIGFWAAVFGGILVDFINRAVNGLSEKEQ